MKRTLSCLLTLMAATAFAAPLPIKGYSIEKTTFGGDYFFRTSTIIPKAFPKTPYEAPLFFFCDKGLDQNLNALDWLMWKTSNKISSTQTSMQFNNTKVSCSGKRLVVSDPKLFTLLYFKPYTQSTYSSDSAAFLTNPTATEFYMSNPDSYNATVTISRVGNVLSVKDNRKPATIAVSQGSSELKQLSYQGKNGTIKIDTKMPFGLHVTIDGGETWTNVIINLSTPTLTLWTSDKTP